MERIHGYDAWRLASPPDPDPPDGVCLRCWDAGRETKLNKHGECPVCDLCSDGDGPECEEDGY